MWPFVDPADTEDPSRPSTAAASSSEATEEPTSSGYADIFKGLVDYDVITSASQWQCPGEFNYNVLCKTVTSSSSLDWKQIVDRECLLSSSISSTVTRLRMQNGDFGKKQNELDSN